MKTRTLPLILAAAGLLSLSGCATQDRSAVQYDANSASQLQQLTYGRVLELRPVTIDLSGNGTNYAGLAIGGLVGGTVGYQAGKPGSSTSQIGAAVGAALGASGAQMAGQALSKAQGVEISLALDDGRRLALVQQDDSTPLHVGQCVKVTFSSLQRVSPSTGCAK
jgi:outer membrane lipoprotein SlyB